MNKLISVLLTVDIIMVLLVAVSECWNDRNVKILYSISAVESDSNTKIEREWEKGCEVYHHKQRRIDPQYYNYSIIKFLRNHQWLGMGDTVTDYPEDSVLYNGLKIDGKSICEVIDSFGTFDRIDYDTLRFGMSAYRPSLIYPLTYKRAYTPILVARKIVHDDIRLTVYFEHINDSTKAIYGYQFCNAGKSTFIY